ncbi:MAG: LysE family translocator [Pseudomonadota bacterium]
MIFNLPIAAETLLIGYATYLVATISPGIANMAIMTTAMREGRKAASSMAFGVVCGSLVWGLVSAAGLGIIISTNNYLLGAIRLFGACYLGWLAYKFARLAWYDHRSQYDARSLTSSLQYYAIGLGIHLTNPKAILAWLSIMAVIIDDETPAFLPFLFAIWCWLSGVVVFLTYAWLFSLPKICAIYQRAARFVNSVSAVVFVIAAIVIFLG